MRPGDVVKIYDTGHEVRDLALYLDKAGKPATLDYQEWRTGQEAQKVEAQPDAHKRLFGSMPTYTFDSAGLAEGLEQETAAGPALVLGSRRRGRHEEIAPLVGLDAGAKHAAVAKAGEHQIVLISAEQAEEGKVLVRVDTSGSYSRGCRGTVRAVRGTPERLVEAWYARGDAGNVRRMADELWVLGGGDILRVKIEGPRPAQALFVQNDELCVMPFAEWRLEDARRDPAEYIAEGWAPAGQVPKEWIGQIVEIHSEADRSDFSLPYLLVKVEGDRVTVDISWDDPQPQNTNCTYPGVVWVHLRDDIPAPGQEPPEQWYTIWQGMSFVPAYDNSRYEAVLPEETVLEVPLFKDGPMLTDERVSLLWCVLFEDGTSKWFGQWEPCEGEKKSAEQARAEFEAALERYRKLQSGEVAFRIELLPVPEGEDRYSWRQTGQVARVNGNPVKVSFRPDGARDQVRWVTSILYWWAKDPNLGKIRYAVGRYTDELAEALIEVVFPEEVDDEKVS